MTTDLLQKLNARQREAVEAIDGPLLIIAGPGSGKTRVITHRIAYLVETVGVTPYRIAAVTFTNKAAREMRERLSTLMGPRSRELTASTFHAFCAMVLRREGKHIGLDRNFSIYDDSDQMAAVKRAMDDVGFDLAPRGVLTAISSAKSQLNDADSYGARSDTPFEKMVHRVYERYDQLLWQSSALDFDDMLFKTYFLFDQFPEVATKYQNRFTHLMVDEFQDTNIAQYAIAKQLATNHRNLCVVGDPDQSIYSWRNADIRNILSFQHDFPEAKVVALEENYRSTQTILSAAHALIQPNEQRVDKELWTSNGKGVPIVVHEAYNEREEAKFVVRELDTLVKSGQCNRSGIAVMYRINAQSRALEEVFGRHGVPYQLVGSLSFFKRQEIKDVIAYLRLIANPSDDVSFARVVNTPLRGIGQRTLDEVTRAARDAGVSIFEAIPRLAADASANGGGPHVTARALKAMERFREMIAGFATEAETMTLVDLLDVVVDRSGYKQYTMETTERGEERWENVQELRGMALDHSDGNAREELTAFLERSALVSDVDNMDEKTDAVTLITLHQAKGLEFPVVFMVGMEDGLLPHARSSESPSGMEEERRLCYVGVTRAKERLYLVRAFRRYIGGISGPRMASQFLSDLPKDLIAAPQASMSPRRSLTTWGVSTISGFSAASSSDEPDEDETPSVTIGDKVSHAKFGSGIVTATKRTGGDLEVTVFFDDAGMKRLLQSFAGLTKVG